MKYDVVVHFQVYAKSTTEAQSLVRKKLNESELGFKFNMVTARIYLIATAAVKKAVLAKFSPELRRLLEETLKANIQVDPWGMNTTLFQVKMRLEHRGATSPELDELIDLLGSDESAGSVLSLVDGRCDHQIEFAQNQNKRKKSSHTEESN